VIGEILQASATSGLEAAFKRATGRTLEDLSADWRDAIQTTFLPQLGDHYRARRIAQPTLTQRRSRGRLFLAPALTPDGKAIAFVTDSGGETDFDLLRFGNLRIALLHLDTGVTELLRNMEIGKNINPVWAPDGRSLAFVSDRTGIANIFLYDLGGGQI